MQKFIGYLLSFIGGVMLAHLGFPFFTWEFWAVAAPISLGSALIITAKEI